MSYISDSSDAGYQVTNENKRKIYSSKKHREKIKTSSQELSSDDSDDSQKRVKLTTLVRETYLSYLIKILSYNYKSTSTNKLSSEKVFSARDIKQCAMQLEQKALQSSVEAGLYRRAMLQMVAAIKRKTEHQELHDTLFNYSQLFGDKGTQTESFLSEIPQKVNKDAPQNDKPMALFPSFTINNENKSDISDHIIGSPTLPSKASHWPPQNVKRAVNNISNGNNQVLSDLTMSRGNNSPDDFNLAKSYEDNEEELLFHPYSESDECQDYDDIESSIELGPSIEAKPSLEMANGQFPKETEMEREFLPTQTLDERLAAIILENPQTYGLLELPEMPNNKLNKRELTILEEKKTTEQSQESPGLSTLDKRLAEIHGESGHQATDKPKKKLVWRYEEIYYTKKLNLKLKSLSTAKRIRLESRFNELFVIGGKVVKKVRKKPVVEDPLLEYKDRIKPWVVKHLMPYYKTGKIDSRDFFKHVARNVTDSLVEANHLPDEADVIDSIVQLFSEETPSGNQE